jgi:hypothetical protein
MSGVSHVREILHRAPPDRLYHYTTQAGLLGIIGQREIWASHTQYLNDLREFQHGLSILKEELARHKRSDQRHAPLVEDLEQGLDGIESINVCVCSFSADEDVLSRWRAYGGAASGFSIGFSGDFLRAVADAVDFWLVPVLYEDDEQREFVRRLVEDVLVENAARRARGDGELANQPPGGNLVAYLNRYAPILKHKSFAEEKEWRIISRPLPCSHERFSYRPSASMLIPYFRIPLSSAQQPFEVQEVVVGPTPYPEQSARSVQGLLNHHSLRDVSVRVSSAPYRSW